MLRRRIKEYIAAALRHDGAVIHAEIAAAFIAEHGDLLDAEIAAIVERYVRAEIKAIAQQPVGHVGQMALPGMPAAITVADGVTKRLESCDAADLAAGRQFKVANIAAAKEALGAYDRDAELLRSLMDRYSAPTVGEALRQLEVDAA